MNPGGRDRILRLGGHASRGDLALLTPLPLQCVADRTLFSAKGDLPYACAGTSVGNFGETVSIRMVGTPQSSVG